MVVGLLKQMDWEDLKSPVLFASGMLVGVILVRCQLIIHFINERKMQLYTFLCQVAIIWYIVQVRKAHEKRQEAKENESQQGTDIFLTFSISQLSPINQYHASKHTLIKCHA